VDVSTLAALGDAARGGEPHDWNVVVIDLSAEEWTAVRLSLRIAITATIASLPLGIFAAYALARWRFPGKMLVDGFIHLPLVLPPVVTGYILLILFGRRGPLGMLLAEYLGIVLSFRWTGAALACAVMGFPLMVRPIRLSIESIDRRLEAAAGTLGANGPWTFALVTLPPALPGLLVGSILCFTKALGEFGATITFVSNIPGQTQTISAAIYTYTQVPGGDTSAWRLTIVSIVIALGALIFSEIVQQGATKRMASFA
jgi:molybdate transport system permease protein